MINEKHESRLRYSWGRIIKAIFASIAVIWIIWQMTAASYKAEIEFLLAEQSSLRQDLETVRRTYRDLAAKTDGLFEPRLLWLDTLGEHRRESETHAGRVRYSLYRPTSNHYLLPRQSDSLGGRIGLRITFSGGSDYKYKLRLGERLDFEVRNKPHYIVFNSLESTDTLVTAAVFELEPIYNPFRRQDSLRSTYPQTDGN